MRAALYEAFEGPITIQEVPDPAPEPDGVVIRVEATGICRSDWHGWMGHDADIRRLPHVPGHELAGVVENRGTRRHPLVSGRPGHHALCLRLRPLSPVRQREPPGLRPSASAGFYPLGLVCRTGGRALTPMST